MSEAVTQYETVHSMRIAADKIIEVKFYNTRPTRIDYDTTPATNNAIAKLLEHRREIALRYFETKDQNLIDMFEMATSDLRKVIGL